MSLKILETLKANLTNYRRKGSTTVMLELYKTIPKFLLVTRDQIHGRRLKEKFNLTNVKILSSLWGQVIDDHDYDYPVAFDNGTVLGILEMAINSIKSLNNIIKHQESRIEHFLKLTRSLGDYLTIWFPYHWDEKKFSPYYKEDEELNRIFWMAYRAIKWNGKKWRRERYHNNAIKYHRLGAGYKTRSTKGIRHY